MRSERQSGFTLVEIMIVVAIVGLLASIAIPNLLRSRVNANEGAIKGNLKTFSSANESYRGVQTPLTYAPDIATLIAASPAYLDGTWTTNPKHGFDLTYSVASAPASTYALLAEPTTGMGGTTDYCVDQSGQVFAADAGTMTGPNTGCTGGTAIS